MSETISSAPITTTKTVSERTWRQECFTELGSDYVCVIHRERVKQINSDEPAKKRTRIAESSGKAKAGTDGMLPDHYPDADGGFEPVISVTMQEVLGYNDARTITAGGVTIKLNVLPLLMQEAFDFVAKKKRKERKDSAISAAIAAAIEAATK